MSEFDGNLHGVITVAMMATFIGIWVWAWRKRHKMYLIVWLAFLWKTNCQAQYATMRTRGTHYEWILVWLDYGLSGH